MVKRNRTEACTGVSPETRLASPPVATPRCKSPVSAPLLITIVKPDDDVVLKQNYFCVVFQGLNGTDAELN
jgi:hypothetical protein